MQLPGQFTRWSQSVAHRALRPQPLPLIFALSGPGYQFLPQIYDRWQQSYGKDFSTLILPKLLHTIKAHDIPRSTLLDLACGTGTLAIMMARRGWDVLGVDASIGMVQEAMRKTDGTRLPIAFTRQDMRSFSVPAQVGLVTCMFDGINHLMNARDLLRCFRCAHHALRTGGYLIFDVNNEFCYTDGVATDRGHQRSGLHDYTSKLIRRREEKCKERGYNVSSAGWLL